MLNIPGSLNYPQWGATAGNALAQGMIRRREEQQQNALAAALPAAMQGDQAALQAVQTTVTGGVSQPLLPAPTTSQQ